LNIFTVLQPNELIFFLKVEKSCRYLFLHKHFIDLYESNITALVNYVLLNNQFIRYPKRKTTLKEIVLHFPNSYEGILQ